MAVLLRLLLVVCLVGDAALAATMPLHAHAATHAAGTDTDRPPCHGGDVGDDAPVMPCCSDGADCDCGCILLSPALTASAGSPTSATPTAPPATDVRAHPAPATPPDHPPPIG